jgi:hypothetical protein
MPILVDLGLLVGPEAVPIEINRVIASAYYEDGKYYPEVVETINTMASVQPAFSGRSNLRDLPEGILNEIKLAVYTDIKLFLDDVMIWNDNKYRCMWVWDREHDGGYTKTAFGLLDEKLDNPSWVIPTNDMRPT